MIKQSTLRARQTRALLR